MTLNIRTKVILLLALSLISLAVLNHVRNQGLSEPLAARLNIHWQELIMQVQAVTANLPAGAEVVILQYDGEFIMSSKEGMRSMEAALAKQGVGIQHIEKIPMSEDYLASFDPLRFPYAEYLRIASEYSDVEAVLSLCGFPVMANGDERTDPSRLPPLLLTRVNVFSGTVAELLEEGRIQAVVTYLESPGPGNAFDDKYEVIANP